MLLNELTTPFEKRRVIMYSAGQTKAVYHNKSMRHAIANIYIGEPEIESYSTYYMAYAWFEEKNIGIAMRTYREYTELDEIDRDARINHLKALEDYIDFAKKKIEAGAWFTLPEVEMLKNVAPELVDGAMQARGAVTKRMKESREADDQKRREEEAAFVQERNAEAEAIINQAMETIKAGGKLENKLFDIYNGRYSHKSHCVVTYLMDKYEVKPPIRTRGWIMNNLRNITIEDGKATNVNYWQTGRSKGSNVVFDYLQQMLDKALVKEPRRIANDIR